MKRTAIDHPKLRRLARLLDLPHYAAVGVMESIWHFTARHAIVGDIGKWDDDEIVDAIDWPAERTGELIEALVKVRLLDCDDNHRLVVHDWHDHCDDSVRKTMKNKGWQFASQKAVVVPENSGTVANFPEDTGTVAISPDCSGGGADDGGNVPDSRSRSHSQSPAKPKPSQEDSSEPPSGSEPAETPILVFPVVGGKQKTWGLLPYKIAEYRESFPGVDVEVEARKALQWVRDNPTKQKTAKGMPKFLGGWMARVQDSGRAGGSGKPTAPLSDGTIIDFDLEEAG